MAETPSLPFADIRSRATALSSQPLRVAVVHPVTTSSLKGALDAARSGIITPILIGPEDKIRARHGRGGALIREAVLKADRGMVFDNSRLNRPPERCLLFDTGRLAFALPILPGWIRHTYAPDLVV